MIDIAQPDLEAVIDAVKQTFEQKFPDELSAVDSAKSNPLKPKAPVQWFFGDRANMPQMPSMMFTGDQTSPEEDEYQWRREKYSLEIEAYVTSDDVEKLNRIVRRYGEAIDQTLRANERMGGVVQEVININQHYWNTVKSHNGLFQAVNVSFDAIVFVN